MGLITVELDEATCKAIRDNPGAGSPRYEDAVLSRLFSYAVMQSQKKLAIKKVAIGKKAAKATYEELPDAEYPFDLTAGGLVNAGKTVPAEAPVKLLLVGHENGKRVSREVPVDSAKIIVNDGVMTLQFSLPREIKEPQKPPAKAAAAPPMNARPEGADAPEDE